ncbi:MAG: aminoacyl-tRNA hydrolase [Kiritimatiellae bacterium]|nr:aminoacyl-tRNA hydrolase [Kiritimatiellia bacterium]
MKVIAGLGNPGAEYAGTPHSIGFEVADRVAAAAGAQWSAKSAFECVWAQGFLGGEKIVVVKPMTYMNLSGKAVAPVLRYSNASVDDLIVVSDDIDLSLGRIRIRKGGSAGGHNGLKSIIASIGTEDFLRVKVGVGRDGRNRGNVISHVLGKFDAARRKIADEAADEAAKAVEFLLSNPVDNAMNRFNGFVAPSAQAADEQGI